MAFACASESERKGLRFRARLAAGEDVIESVFNEAFAWLDEDEDQFGDVGLGVLQDAVLSLGLACKYNGIRAWLAALDQGGDAARGFAYLLRSFRGRGGDDGQSCAGV